MRSPGGALVLLLIVALRGHAQSPDVPTGDGRIVDEPQRWTVKAIRRRGLRVPNDRLVIRNAEILDDLEILIGPR